MEDDKGGEMNRGIREEKKEKGKTQSSSQVSKFKSETLSSLYTYHHRATDTTATPTVRSPLLFQQQQQ
jgi:hypothetical protein